MMESLLVFDSVVNNASVHDVPIFLLLNKADLFEQNISQKPIADYFADYSAGAEYSEACRFFAGRFASLDHRPRGKLYCYVTDSLHTTKFRNAWRQVQEKMIYTTLKY